MQPATSPGQLAANRANSQHSTGPRTAEGKATSSQNRRQHGLSGTHFVVLGWESQADYDGLLSELRAEHKPATPTEHLLVNALTQHQWLSIRAGILGECCFDNEDSTQCAEARLALFLRYQAHHERAFHKCLNQFLKLRRERQREHDGFVRETMRIANGHRSDDRHFLQLELLQLKLETAKAAAKPTSTPTLATETAPVPPETARNTA